MLPVAFILSNNKMKRGNNMSTYTRVNMSTFIKDKINLDPEVTKKARSSRDFLHEQLVALPEKTTNFPKLFSNRETFNYGSFSRRTKIRPLDDIDFMLLFQQTGLLIFKMEVPLK